MIKALIFLLLSQVSSAMENKKYLNVGANPISPKLLLNGEKIFPVEKDTLLTTYDGDGRKHTGWLSTDYHFVGKLENGQWQAKRIYECGNPILNPRIIIRNTGQELFNPLKQKTKCECSGKDWFFWTVGPGLIGYGGGARENIPIGIGGGVVAANLFGKSNPKIEKCKTRKKWLIRIVSAGIGWAIGNALYKPENQTRSPGTSTSSSSGGPGPIPPNGYS